MKLRGNNSGRDTLPSVFLGFMMPGLGQIYNGELVKGASFFIIIMVTMFVGIRGSLLLPDSLLIYGALTTMITSAALYIWSIVEAFNTASKSNASYILKPYNRWYFYLAMWLLGSAISGSGQGYIRDHYIEAYKIPAQSMQPTVQQGDCVLADKTAYDRLPPKKGDIIIFLFPDDRSKKFIKRIEALPGDSITKPDGTTETVPHGFAYVLGDNRENSYDSRQFGFIPLRDIIAKVRQVYFSSGAKGILWERVGVVVGSRQ
jgi:signal peptidase I